MGDTLLIITDNETELSRLYSDFNIKEYTMKRNYRVVFLSVLTKQ